VLDDRNGRPATQVFDHVLANRISQLRIRQFRSCPPVRPYKANVGGSIPSAPTNQILISAALLIHIGGVVAADAAGDVQQQSCSLGKSQRDLSATSTLT
jgi:hypothetical protein